MEIKKKLKETKVLVGQPKIYPVTVVQEMKKFFKENLSIEKAYLECIQYLEPNIHPKLLVGIKSIDQSLEIMVADLENYLSSKKIKLTEIDFVEVNQDPFINYFTKIKPFYIKSEIN